MRNLYAPLNPENQRHHDRADASAICVELVGVDICIALGTMMVHDSAPVPAMCRLLIEARHDPDTPLHAYRDDVLALKGRSIGEGACLTVEDDKLGRPTFPRRRDRQPMRYSGPAYAVGHPKQFEGASVEMVS